MSCGSCGGAPCSCPPDPCHDPCANLDLCQMANPEPHCRTLCDLDKCDNLWYDADQPGYPGTTPQCKLDQLTYGQIVEVLERNPFAAQALQRITSDPCLLQLARTVKLRVPEQEDNARAAARINANSLPYYTFFRGNVGGDPGQGKVGK